MKTKNNLLARWLNETLTEEELYAFENSKDFLSYKRIAEQSKNIQIPAFDKARLYQKIANKRTEKTKNAKIIALNKGMLRIATVLLIGLVTYWGSQFLNTSVSTNIAKKTDFNLPDGSEVSLNSDSKVTYNKSNWEKERRVELTGEAFFKVKKGERFTVSYNDGKVVVLGTQFNVKSRPNQLEVFCYEGAVMVQHKNKIDTLYVGESFQFIEGKTKKSYTDNITSWSKEESTFNAIPLKYVLKEFERQYNKKIKYSGVDLNSIFTGSFSNNDLELALKSISQPLNLNYKSLNDTTILIHDASQK